MYQRNILKRVAESVRFSPVTLLNGARQTGKSTFLQNSFVQELGFQGINLDDLNLLRLAKTNPITFLSQLNDRVAIDEIQRAPEIMLPLKQRVDQDRSSKRFLLSGSANVLSLPKLSESLAGRMEIHTLWPLSQGELRGVVEDFVGFLFSDDTPRQTAAVSQGELLDIIVRGGYPEALAQMQAGRGPDWFKGYITTILQRDVLDISRIEGLAELPNLLELIASRAGNLINVADLSRITQMSAMTLKRYTTLLEQVFLVVPVPAWGNNPEKRLVKSPKVFLNDTGLLCFLRGLTQEAFQRNRSLLGGVMENFVVMELQKQLGWSGVRAKLHHFRSARGDEVDCVLQAADGRVVGVEVKSSMDLSPSDFNGLRTLSALAGKAFHRGVILYTGPDIIRYDESLWALPIAALWK